MKAVQYDPIQKKVVINNVPIPEPGENEFLVRVASASLCHSDLMAIGDSFIPGRTEPVTLGHEGAGYIEKLHPTAEGKGFTKGDAIGFLYIIGCCFECDGCQVHNNHCLTRPSYTQGFTFDGFFAEYALVDYHSAIILPKKIAVRVASPLFCAGVTAFHCVESCGLDPGQWLVIVGCGGLGQLAIQYAKAMRLKVIGVDIHDSVLEVALKQGADYVFNSRANKDYVQQVKQITGSTGADAVAVFSAAEAAYRSATPLIKLGGVLMVVGLPDKGVTLDALDIARGTFRVKGDSTGIPSRMPRAIEFTAEHNILPEVEVYPSLDDVPKMIEKMQAEQSTKRMLVDFSKL
ncbi:alcohol dehydrogenase [Rhizodiscina lignyota]|uniref:Alcohol dehydrogenase n=1 Tax=Rhizodiscina lignyota TaxID=1504668 RepID=A0A9P4IHA2_9PEZI|nr:alcohol dehydrogenase [Rhizodiscina lignyota]